MAITLDKNSFSDEHESVMPEEVLEYMNPQKGGIYIDGTFGAGGHARRILKAADCTLYGFDRDPHVKRYADALKKKYKDRFHFVEERFSRMHAAMLEQGVDKVDGILLDIGVSSMQLDTARRGFSFQADGPLDMRMQDDGPTAADLVNTASEQDLAGVIFKYGDERASRRIARTIVLKRATEPFTTTKQLASAVVESIGMRPGAKIHPATKTFQALRIWVNQELDELNQALKDAGKLLKPGGRLVIISFHSGEDRLVKSFLQAHSSKREHVNKYKLSPPPSSEDVQTFSLLTHKVVAPGESEISHNPRARSAKLRAAERTGS